MSTKTETYTLEDDIRFMRESVQSITEMYKHIRNISMVNRLPYPELREVLCTLVKAKRQMNDIIFEAELF